MKKATYILFLVLFVISLPSCMRYHTGLQRSNSLELKPVVFPQSFNKALYKTNIHFFKKEFSGLMFFKHSPQKQEVRLVFMSEFGLKYFDFKLTDSGEFTVEYIIDELNRKSVISVLEKDFKLLFQRGVSEGGFVNFDAKRKGFYVQKMRMGKSRNYYFIDKITKHVLRIESSAAVFKNTKITLSDFSNEVAKEIEIKHYGMNLKLNLRLVE